MDNYMKLEIAAISENENFARNAVAAFALTLNPSLAEISDIKTAVSEAVTNCIVHAYEKKRTKLIENKILVPANISTKSTDVKPVKAPIEIKPATQFWPTFAIAFAIGAWASIISSGTIPVNTIATNT